MFGRFMNNYYYGKSGKGDFRKEDMPETRMQLFWDTLRTRLSALCRLNLMYALVFLPAMVVLMIGTYNLMTQVNVIYIAQQGNLQEYVDTINEQQNGENAEKVTVSDEVQAEIASTDVVQVVNSLILRTLLWLIPCIAITGPFTAGVSYVTRNWARDEHAFIWSDFKDALKANWKQSLVISAITSILTAAAEAGKCAAEQPAAGCGAAALQYRDPAAALRADGDSVCCRLVLRAGSDDRHADSGRILHPDRVRAEPVHYCQLHQRGV